MGEHLKGIGSPVPEVQPVGAGMCRYLQHRAFSSELPLLHYMCYPTLRKPEGRLLIRYRLF